MRFRLVVLGIATLRNNVVASLLAEASFLLSFCPASDALETEQGSSAVASLQMNDELEHPKSRLNGMTTLDEPSVFWHTSVLVFG